MGPQVQSASNSNQKEKYEGDLKKEIKKLQVIYYPLYPTASLYSPRSGGFMHLRFPCAIPPWTPPHSARGLNADALVRMLRAAVGSPPIPN